MYVLVPYNANKAGWPGSTSVLTQPHAGSILCRLCIVKGRPHTSYDMKGKVGVLCTLSLPVWLVARIHGTISRHVLLYIDYEWVECVAHCMAYHGCHALQPVSIDCQWGTQVTFCTLKCFCVCSNVCKIAKMWRKLLINVLLCSTNWVHGCDSCVQPLCDSSWGADSTHMFVHTYVRTYICTNVHRPTPLPMG